MLSQENFFYSILIDVIIPIGTLVIGIITERTLNITFRISNFFKDESRINQSQTIKGENNTSAQAGNVHGDMYVGTKKSAVENEPSTTAHKSYQLPHDDKQFVLFVEDKLKYFDLNNVRFHEVYEKGYSYLNNNRIDLASSEYYTAFRKVKEVFLDRSKYIENPPEELIMGFSKRLGTLKEFSKKEDMSKDNLSEIVDGLEDNIVDLSKHLP